MIQKLMLVSNNIYTEQTKGVEVIYRDDLFIINGKSLPRETLGDSGLEWSVEDSKF